MIEPYYQDDAVTIYLGDALEITPALSGIDAVITDPPYGMDYDTNSTRFKAGHGGNNKDWGKRVLNDDKPFEPLPWLAFDKVILWGFNHFAARLPTGTTLVWLKKYDHLFGTFLSDAELAWMKGGCGVYCRRDTSLLGETRERIHPTQKPLNIMKWCIEKAKVPAGGLILDPFMGSGTTLRAAKNLGLKAIGIEIEEKYCEIAAKRMAQEVLAL